MLRIFFIYFVCMFVFGFLYAGINVVVSIEPQKTILDAIAKDKVNSISIIKENVSMHGYEPKPSVMRKILEADIYLSLSLEFEHIWLASFSKQNSKMIIVDISRGISKIPILDHGHDHSHKHENEDEKLDPHIWTSLKNTKIIAKNILTILIKVDKNNSEYYTNNYNDLINKINDTDSKIRQILKNSNSNKKKFIIVHPSWGYFARDYNLEQISLEIEGKSPKISRLYKLMKEIKSYKVKSIFIQKGFSDKKARQIAKELNLEIISVSNLDENYFQNLINFAKEVAK